LQDLISLSITGAVAASSGVYIESAGAAGITVGANASVDTTAGFNVSFQTNAVSIANGGTVGSYGVVFELAPDTQGLGVTLGATGSGLSLVSLAGIAATTLRIGAVTLPGGEGPTTTAGAIVIGGSFGADFIDLDLEAIGQVTQAPGAVLSAFSLGGTAASFLLTNVNNVIVQIGDLVATGGDITIVDSTDLTLTGTQSANNLFFEVAAGDGELTLGQADSSATLTAAAGGRITLVADAIGAGTGDTITAPGGTVELSPFSVMNASLQGGNGLGIDSTLLAAISTGATGTLVIGGFTDVPNGGTTPTPHASSISIDAATDLTGIAGTLDLLTTGAVTQSAALTARTLIGNAGTVTLDDNGNNIATLGSFTTTTANFDLNDTGNTGTLTVTGPVTSPTQIAMNTGGTGAIDVTGNIGAGSLLAVIAGSGGIAVNGTANLTGTTVDLATGSGTIAINNTAVVGQTGALVDLIATGNITQAAGASLVAATLEASSNAVIDLAGNANAIGALNGVVATTSITLNDATSLTVNAELLAPRIALLAPGQTVTLGDGATIITNGTPPGSPGPLVPADEPSNGAPGAYIQAASFVQTGLSLLTSGGTGQPTLQISVTNSATFDPPTGLQASTGWLILNLGSGTASGNVFVDALNVTYTGNGSANLTGTIAGVAGTAAAASGFIQPTLNVNYLFNGCEIGSAACLPIPPPPPPPPPVIPPPTPPTSEIPLLPPLYPDLPSAVPPLPSLPTLVLVSVPPLVTPACTPPVPGAAGPNAPTPTCALTDPDVVPPNVSPSDY
jgi:hypothetical protein